MKCSKDFFMKLVFGVTALMGGVNADAASVVSRGKVASRAPVAKQVEPVKQEVVEEQPVVVEK